MNNMVIIGQGAMGLLWYGTLRNQPELNVSVRSSQPCWQQIKHIAFNQYQGLPHLLPFNAASDQQLTEADVIIICTKAYQITQAIRQIQPLLNPRSVIILAHNGILTPTEMCLNSINNVVLTLLTTHACLKPNALHAIHTGLGSSDIGIQQGTLSVTQQQRLITLLNHALPNVNWHAHIQLQQWLKLAVNCIINPLTALDNVDNGVIATPKYHTITKQLLTELILVANTQHIPLEFHELFCRIQQVAQATAHNCSSMRADLLAKRETEIDYINGYIVKCAELHGVSVPAHTHLCHAIRQRLSM